MGKPLVTIIVSNINGMKLNLLGDCLDSLTRQDYPNWELIVVDNGSNDDSVKYLKKRFAKSKNCKVIQNPVNMYTQGINIAVDAAKGKYIANFNNDLALNKNYIRLLVNEMEKDNNLAIVQGILLNYYHRDIVDSAGETMDIYGNPVTIGSGEKFLPKYNKNTEILSVCGAACLFSKSLFLKLGKYDPDYGIGYEDMDWSLRSRRLGYSLKIFPEAKCFHKRAKTDLEDFVRIKVKWHFNKNRLSTMIKNYPVSLLFKALPVTILLYFGITLWEWVVKRNWKIGWTRLSSIFWVVFNIDSILTKRYKINKLNAKGLVQKDFKLFSSKPVLSLFKDFKAS